MQPKTSLTDFEALVRRAGLALADDKVRELHGAWGHVEAMLARIRTPGRDRAAEPAVSIVRSVMPGNRHTHQNPAPAANDDAPRHRIAAAGSAREALADGATSQSLSG